MATLQEVVAETAETKEYSVPASFENHTQNIELDTLPSLPPTASPSDLEQTFHENTDTTVTRNEISHAPVDGGLEAWSFLAAAFAVDAIVWSFPFAFGVFLSVYLKDPRWISQKHAYTLLPLTGTLSTGLIYCSGAFINPLLGRYPQYRRMAIWCGAVICGSSLLAASFASDVIYLVVTQGCLYGIGGGLTYYPTLSFMQEWFVRRRGLANGVMFTGTSIVGLFLPLVLPRIISSHGTSLTLRYFAISIFVALAVVVPFIKPRLPVQTVHGPRTRSSEKPWLKNWTWWFVLLMNTVQGFAHFVPVVWLPTYTSALNASASTASLSLALLNAATAIGQFSMGLLSDHFSPWPLAAITLSCCSLATFILWGVAGYAVAGILVYGTCFGILVGGFSSLYTGFVKPIAKDDTLLSVQLFGLLLFSRGLGNVLSTPISTALSASTHIIAHQRTGFDVDGGRYEKMIIYVGSCLAGAAVVALGGWMRERIGR